MFLTVLALTLGAPGLKDKADPAESIVGLWELERAEGGTGNVPTRKGPLRYRFDKDGNWVVLEGERELVGARAVKIDPAAKPATLDFSVSAGSPEQVLGIYKIEGDKLTICKAFPGKDRPSKFEVRDGSQDYLMVFKRVKPKD